MAGIFDSITINGVTFANRVLRSSLGGRTAYYDGTVSPTWKNFERLFARHGVGGIISATIDVDDDRLSPLEYPKISHDRFIAPLREGVEAVQALGCRYIMQIGDAGGHTQMSLFPQEADGKSASSCFDLLYGYRNRTTAMIEDMGCREITAEVDKFAQAARRVREIGCDGVEVTASKGYIIHQFLNPATNRRDDDYGGDRDRRFRLLHDVVVAVRKEVGKGFLFGVRLSAKDYNWLPVGKFRWPPVWPLSHYFIGNTLTETLGYGRRLKELGVDYLHIDSGFGFINPKGSPGDYPLEGLRNFANASRHLSAKARVRAAIINALPDLVARATLGIGWKYVPAANAHFAECFKHKVGLPVISNGGFQERDVIEKALQSQCDMVAIGRPLIANPNLLEQFRAGRNEPENKCNWCNLCCTRTAVHPLGCYDIRRFRSQDEMEEQILAMSADPTP